MSQLMSTRNIGKEKRKEHETEHEKEDGKEHGKEHGKILFHLERKYHENLESECMTVQNIVSANTRTVRI
jgi:hypothetical protein